MERWFKKLAGIGLATAWVVCAGCGGGSAPHASVDNAPHASMDYTAASDSAPEPSIPPPAPAAGKPAPAPAAVAAAVKAGPAPSVAAKEGKDDSCDEKQEGADEPTPAERSPDGGASTAEMLAMATSNQPASTGGAAPGPSSLTSANPASPGGAAPAGFLSTHSRGQGGMPAGYPSTGNPGGRPAGYPGAGNPMRAGGAPGLPGPGGMPAGYPGPGGQPGGPSGYPGDPGSSGMTTGYPGRVGGGGPASTTTGRGASGEAIAGRGAGGANPDVGPVDIRSPDAAVRSFLFALRSRDKDRLAEATALRAQTESSSEKSKELFGKIVLGDISDAELDDIAKKLDGYQVAGKNAVHSTGRLSIIIVKPTTEGGYLTRAVTVRKEKKGWGVMDIGSPTEFRPTAGGLRHRYTGTGVR